MADVSGAVQSFGGEPFRVGATLSRSFDVFGRGLVQFLVISLCVFLPIFLVKAIIVLSLPTKNAMMASALTSLLFLPLSAIAHGACMVGAYRLMRGDAFSVWESFSAVTRRLPPLLGVGVVSGLAAGLASLLLIMPGVIVLLMFYVAAPACMLEKRGVFDSLGRSRELTKGHRWSLFGLLLLFGVVGGIVAFLLGFAIAAMHVPFAASVLIQFPWTVVIGAFGAVVVAVIYHDLRVAKEGVDIEKLANVFD